MQQTDLTLLLRIQLTKRLSFCWLGATLSRFSLETTLDCFGICRTPFLVVGVYFERYELFWETLSL